MLTLYNNLIALSLFLSISVKLKYVHLYSLKVPGLLGSVDISLFVLLCILSYSAALSKDCMASNIHTIRE